MASAIDDDSVTISREYFQVLLRKAAANDAFGHLTVPVVTIDEHKRLREQVRQFETLKKILVNGGLTHETIAILTNANPEDAAEDNPKSRLFGESVENNRVSQAHSHRPPSGMNNYTYQNRNQGGYDCSFQFRNHGYDAFAYARNSPADDFSDNDNGTGNGNENPPLQSIYTDRKPRFQRDAQRSIVLSRLQEGTTLADVVDVVRGGMLLEVYLRRNDRSCVVSFLEEQDARAFHGHAKRYDLRILDRRVEIYWAERQFALQGHVANKISIGATRNLIIRNASTQLTEQGIREHSDHIHKLVVIKVVFEGQHIIIKCNSIYNAMYLKTCLKSRALYKNFKIDWYEDECAGPLPTPAPRPKKEVTARPVKSTATLNRFQALNMDGTEDGSGDETEHETSVGTIQTHVTTTTGYTG